MKILGFETASSRCSVAITNNNELLAAELLTSPSMQAEQLLSMIESVLNKAMLKLNDIDYLVVTNGPGSFTGIRIGLAAALGIVMSTKITPIVVTNFATINFRIREQFRNFDYAATIIDAYRGEYYLQIFDKYNQLIDEPKLLVLTEIENEINKLDGKIVCAGSASHKLLHLSKKIFISPRFPNPDARTLCKLAYSNILKKNYSSSLEPLYIRLPDAKLPSVTKKMNKINTIKIIAE